MSERFLGIDVGSVTTKIVLIDENAQIIFESYRRNDANPIGSIQASLRELVLSGEDADVGGVGTTGSGRELAAVIAGADVVKNEITAHARAASFLYPDVGTVIDIGGQDSKVIFFENAVPVAFNMNTVCAAGTGSFLDHQAMRMGLSVEEFGRLALRSNSPARIAGRCGVFAESDLVHKQQMGYSKEDLAAGLCDALAGNFVSNVAKGRRIKPRVLFQGGVAANEGMRRSLEKKIGLEITVPAHFKVMGALGAALLARERWLEGKIAATRFRGAKVVSELHAARKGFICDGCSNSCEVQEIILGGRRVAVWGSKCGKWDYRDSGEHVDVRIS